MRSSAQRIWSRIPPDARIAAFLFSLAAVIGAIYNATWGGIPQFWQNTTFTQGLMWVCGHGFENPMVSDIPGLEPFLNSEVDCFDCAKIPANVRILPRDTSRMTFNEIDAYHPQPQFPGFLAWQRYHLYLVLAVTACWWIFGVSWSALTPLCGALYGVSAAAAYGLFRLGMRRGLATAAALLLIVSPLHLQMVPHLRDYAKAPFILLALLIMGCLIKHGPALRRLLVLSGLCGAVIGVGLGFRTDLALCFPAFFGALVFTRGSRTGRIGAAILYTAVFLITSYPILIEVFRETGHFCHVAILGLLRYCDARLGVGAALYHLGDPYSDFYVANVVQAYVHRLGDAMPPSHVMMPEYHEATQRFYAAYLKVFPGDMILRAYAAVLRVLDELHINPQHPYPAGITNAVLCRLYDLRAFLLDHRFLGNRYLAIAALAALAACNLRWGFGALFLLLYFAGYPAIQFNLRHVFHLEFLSLWTAGFLLQQAVNTLNAMHNPQKHQVLLSAAISLKKTGGKSTVNNRHCERSEAILKGPSARHREKVAISWRRRQHWFECADARDSETFGFIAHPRLLRFARNDGASVVSVVRKPLLRLAVFAVISALILTALLQGARWRQSGAVGPLARQMADADLEPLPWRDESAADGAGLIRFPSFADLATASPETAAQSVLSEYLVIELTGADATVPVTFVYEAENREHFDYTRTVEAPVYAVDARPSRVYFPLYYSRESRFMGVRVPAEYRNRLAAFFRVRNADAIPLWLTWILPPDWEELPRHQCLTR